MGVKGEQEGCEALAKQMVGRGALGSTLRVFSEAAGEAAELGETGPEHGLEHQVGGGGWRRCPLLGAVSAFGRWAQPPTPLQQRPLQRCWELLPRAAQEVGAPPCPIFIVPSRGNEAGRAGHRGGLAQLFLPKVA